MIKETPYQKGEEEDAMGMGLKTLTVSIYLILSTTYVSAQAVIDPTEKELERFRAMISDPMANPGFLAVDRGEALWSQKRGKKNASLESCDLGEGPG